MRAPTPAVVGRGSQAAARARGFTLIELMLAMTIGTIVVGGAVTAMLMISQTTLRARHQARVDQEAKLLNDWLLSYVQEVGGGSVRPNMAVSITDGGDTTNCVAESFPGGDGTINLPDCDGTDRLHFLVIGEDAPQCAVTGIAGSNVDMDMACCPSDPGVLENETVIVVDAHGRWQTRHCFNHRIAGPNCRCNFPPGQSAYNPPGGPVDEADGAYITQGSSWTIFLDTDTHVLSAVADFDGDGDAEVRELAPNVYDFQAALLYDLDEDGRTEPTEHLEPPSFADADNLRMLKLGLTVGADVPSREQAATAQILNGPVRTEAGGVILRSVVSKTSLRNLFLFY